MATFKDANSRVTNIGNPAPTGISRANKVCEKKKLTEDVSTEGMCGSISDIDKKITQLEDKIEALKNSLNSLKSAASALSGASCVGDHSCNIAGLLSSYSSAHIAAINAEISALETDLQLLEYTRTLYAFMKPDNMIFN